MEIQMLKHRAIAGSEKGGRPVTRRFGARFKALVAGLALAFAVSSAGCSKEKPQPRIPDKGTVQAPVQKPPEDNRYKAGFSIRQIAGLKKNVRYWSEVYRNKYYMAVIAENHSRNNMKILDFSDKWVGRPAITRRANIEKFIMDPMIESENMKRKCLGKKKDCIVKKPLVYKTGLKDMMEKGASLYTQWRAHVEEIFAERGVPPYLAALMIVESQCNPLARSDAAAVGPYQLTHYIVTDYNLYVERAFRKDKSGKKKKVYKIDERMNWILSAIAAARFFERWSKNLMKSYGNVAYLLSSSAYQAGPTNLKAALKSSEETLEIELKRKPTAQEIFAHAIYSPQYTLSFASKSKDYPPQLYAAFDLLNSIPQEKILPTKEFELILLVKPKPIKLSALVEKLGIPKEKFLELNPQYNPELYDEIMLGGKYDIVRFLAPKGSFEKVLKLEEKIELGKTFVKRFYARDRPSENVKAACKKDRYCLMEEEIARN